MLKQTSILNFIKKEIKFKCDFPNCQREFETKRGMNIHRTSHFRTIYFLMKRKQERKISRKKFVYFIQANDYRINPIKIGYSKNFKSRLNDLQTSNPFRLKTLALIRGDKKMEYSLHRKFSYYNIHGEWFFPKQELLNFIEEKRRLSNIPEIKQII